MKICAIEGGTGKSRYGRRRSRSSVSDKLTCIALANGLGFRVDSRNAIKKLPIANCPIICSARESRTYYRGESGSWKRLLVPSFVDGSREAIVEECRKLLRTTGLTPCDTEDAFDVERLRNSKTGSWLQCHDGNWEVFAVSKWFPERAFVAEHFTSCINVGWYATNYSLATPRVVAHIVLATLGGDPFFVVTEALFSAALLQEKLIFDLNPYVSFEEDTVAISGYVGAKVVPASSVLSEVTRKLLQKGLMLTTPRRSSNDNGSKVAEPASEDLTDEELAQFGSFFDDKTTITKEMPSAMRGNVVTRIKKVIKANKRNLSADLVKKFLDASDTEVQERLNSLLSDDKTALLPIKYLDAKGQFLGVDQVANATRTVLSRLFSIAPDSISADDTLLTEMFDFLQEDDVSSTKAVAQVELEDVYNALDFLAAGGMITSEMRSYLKSNLESNSDQSKALIAASEFLRFGGDSFKVTTEPLPVSMKVFNGFDTLTGRFVSVSGSPLFHLTNSSYSLWDSLGSYAFIECDNPGSQGFNNDIPGNANKNLTSECVWYYPPATPCSLVQSIKSLSTPSDNKHSSELYRAYKGMRIAAPDIQRLRVKSSSEISREPLLNKNLRQSVDGMVWAGNLHSGFEEDDFNSDYVSEQLPELKGPVVEAVAHNALLGVLVASLLRERKLEPSSRNVSAISRVIDDTSIVLESKAYWDICYSTSRATDRSFISVEDVLLPVDISGDSVTFNWALITPSGYEFFDVNGDYVYNAEQQERQIACINQWLTYLVFGRDNRTGSGLSQTVLEEMYG